MVQEGGIGGSERYRREGGRGIRGVSERYRREGVRGTEEVKGPRGRE